MYLRLVQSCVRVAVCATALARAGVADAVAETPASDVVACDNTLPLDTRMAAYQEIVRNPDLRVRSQMLQKLASFGDETVACSALTRLIWDGGVPNAASVRRVVGWAEGNKLGVLGAIVDAGWFRNTKELTAIPLALLTDKEGQQSTSVKTVAAIFLGHAGAVDGEPVLWAVVREDPNVLGAWIGIAMLGKDSTPKDVRAIARNVYIAEDRDVAVRVAAANVASEYDETAKLFVNREMGKFLSDFGELPYVEVVAKAMGGNLESLGLYEEFRAKARLLAVLPVVDVTTGQRLLRDYYRAPNPVVADCANVVGAMRWPQEYFSQDADKEHKSFRVLLAIAALSSPDFRAKAIQLGGQDGLDEQLTVVRKTGVKAQFWKSAVLFGFVNGL